MCCIPENVLSISFNELVQTWRFKWNVLKKPASSKTFRQDRSSRKQSGYLDRNESITNHFETAKDEQRDGCSKAERHCNRAQDEIDCVIENNENQSKLEKRFSSMNNRDEGAQPAFRTVMDKFKAMDKANNPQGAKPNFASGHKTGAANAKEVMLHWCNAVTKDYEGVDIKNFGSSWSDGLAFCALIHHFYPDSFNFSELKPENRRHNFELAFEKAEKLGNVATLLEVDDLMRMKVPDWKCIFTQVQLFYRRFHLEEGKNAHVPPTGIIPKAAPPKSENN